MGSHSPKGFGRGGRYEDNPRTLEPSSTLRTLLTNARLILSDTVVDDASLLVEDESIVAACPESAARASAIDLHGDWLMPGMVDLHCDAIEKEIEPRPGVTFPLPFAIANADKRNASAGITTVYHALSFAHDELGVRNVQMAADIAHAIHTYRPHGLVDNRVHARYEITDAVGYPVLAGLMDEADLELLSFMDHSPGQGQFKTLDAYRDYVVRTYHRTPEEAERMAQEKIATRDEAVDRVRHLARLALERGVRLASHDDDSEDRVEEVARLGARISEFPINLEAAVAARRHGMATLFGAPNILRGGSHSGSMKALEAVEKDVADGLCSDYAPAALLAAAFRLPSISSIGLPQAIALVSTNPAAAVGLTDRGRIDVGARADLVAVREVDGYPQVTAVWTAGRLTYRASYA
ncbi:MAG: alpha-D-ribose 1-methylphosphonate 5-triphosphate diphosphatase [Betaproteobacteria bacterium]|nr:alpha-D-ribose 1-methylphosphonate 5-triphosphate diphosphatase [Betaproteobacteria bacterium]